LSHALPPSLINSGDKTFEFLIARPEILTSTDELIDIGFFYSLFRGDFLDCPMLPEGAVALGHLPFRSLLSRPLGSSILSAHYVATCAEELKQLFDRLDVEIGEG